MSTVYLSVIMKRQQHICILNTQCCTKTQYLYLGCQSFGRLHHEVKTLHHLGCFILEFCSEQHPDVLVKSISWWGHLLISIKSTKTLLMINKVRDCGYSITGRPFGNKSSPDPERVLISEIWHCLATFTQPANWNTANVYFQNTSESRKPLKEGLEVHMTLQGAEHLRVISQLKVVCCWSLSHLRRFFRRWHSCHELGQRAGSLPSCPPPFLSVPLNCHGRNKKHESVSYCLALKQLWRPV